MEKRVITQSGLTLIELLVGMAVIAAFMTAAMTTFQKALELANRNSRAVQAAYLAEEGVEALKLMRDNGWQASIAPLVPGTAYYFEFAGGMWKSTTTNLFLDGMYERKFVLSQVRRDATTKDIVASGGALDASTTQATVSVSWRGSSGTTTKSIATYIVNLFAN